jgi:ComEC/Rec2-related protein
MKRVFAALPDKLNRWIYFKLTFSEKTSLILILSSIVVLTINPSLSPAVLIFTVSVISVLVLAIALQALRNGGRIVKYGKWGVSLFYLCIFFLSLGYGLYRSVPPHLRTGEIVTARLRLVSQERTRAGSVQYSARVIGIIYSRSAEMEFGEWINPKVLVHIPFPARPLERGYVIESSGMFLKLPFRTANGYAHYLQSSGITAIFEGSAMDVRVFKEPKVWAPVSIADRLHRYIERVNERLLPSPHSAFATALLTGNRDPIPRYLAKLFRRSGTMHILAVSGLHVGFLSILMLFFLRLCRCPSRLAYILLCCFIIFFMFFVGERPSVRRASLMAMCGIACFLFDRDRNYLNVLALTFIILWVVNPLSLMNPGFLLSFSATFGILFLVPFLNRIMQKWIPTFLSASISVTLAVQLFIFPIMAAYFEGFPYINLIANLPVVPLSGIALALDVITLVLYPMWLPLAVITAEVNTVVIATIVRLAKLFAWVPPLSVSNFPAFLIGPYMVAVTVVLWLIMRKAGNSTQNLREENEVKGLHGSI